VAVFLLAVPVALWLAWLLGCERLSLLTPARGCAMLPGMTDADRYHLLFGPYKAPTLRRGDRAMCLVRDCMVVVTAWTDARIPWPRCCGLDGGGAGSGLPVNGKQARAVHTEAAAAVCYWWGVVYLISLASCSALRRHTGRHRADRPQ
jgi:hypothetical protein